MTFEGCSISKTLDLGILEAPFLEYRVCRGVFLPQFFFKKNLINENAVSFLKYPVRKS